MPGLTNPGVVPPRPDVRAARHGGLRLLAALVNDAVTARVTPLVASSLLGVPMLATAGGPVPADGSMWQATIGGTTRSPRPSAPTPQGRTAVPADHEGVAARVDTPPLNGAGLNGTGLDGSGPEFGADESDIDAEHIETWRLVQRAQTGDGEAFGQLYDRYVDTVFRFIYFRVNDRALAEDFTSETFLRALRRIGSISYQGRDIGAWLVTIARNIVLDHMKSARHRLESPTADTIEGREHQPSTEAAVLDSLQSERLMAAVAQLGDEQRECVLLRFVHGMSVSETAAIMGKNDGAIKALQHRAVRKLADLVGAELR